MTDNERTERERVAQAEVTQADRDAAVEWYSPRESEWTGLLAQAFARHREQAEAETVAEIVAWLRETARLFSVEIQAGEGRRDTSELLHHKRACTLAAKAIEAGEWK